jgi:hypothetical protein
MSLTAAFLAHEARTQFRSGRFRLLAALYVIFGSLPALLLFIRARSAVYVIAPSVFTGVMSVTQPILTTVLAALIAVDAITRERDDNSFGVVSLAPMTNSGYLLRRWLAVSLVALSVTIVPRAIAGAFCYALTHTVPASLGWTWLLRVVPAVFLTTAIAIAFGTIVGRTFFAMIAAFGVFTFGVELLNDVLAKFHRHVEAILSPLLIDPADINVLSMALNGNSFPGVPTASGPFLANEWQSMRIALPLAAGIAAILLGITPAFLRRSRRAVKPWPIRPAHPLRGFLALMNRLRENYTPDAGIEAADLALILLGVALLAGGWAMRTMRETRFQSLAASRYLAEVSQLPEPTPMALIPVSIAITGKADDVVDTQVTLNMKNTAAQPVSHLAFTVSPLLDISVNAGRVTRHWNRLAIDLDRPIGPFAPATFVFRLRGDSGQPLFRLRARGAFVTQYAVFRRSKMSTDLSDLARSEIQPASTPGRMMLHIDDIGVLPRYTPFDLTSNETGMKDVRREAVAPVTDVSINLRVRDDLLVADSCGAAAQAGSLTTRCRFALPLYAIVSAPLQTTTIGSSTIAYIPAHAGVARVHGEAYEQAIGVAAKVWPGLTLRRETMLVEFPSLPNSRYYGEWDYLGYMERLVSTSMITTGALTIMPEGLFVRRRAIRSNFLATSIVTNAIIEKRSVVPAEQSLYHAFIITVARSRVAGERSSAAVPGVGPQPTIMKLMGADWVAEEKLQPLVADLENRVGSDQLIEAINAFSTASESSGTMRELFATISQRGGVSLDRFFNDYFEGTSLPRLTLANVTFRRDGDQWTTAGTLRNLGTGEALCPIVLRTAFASSRQVIRIDSNQDVPFTITSASEPRALQLDPDGVCYRYAFVGSIESVEHRSGS